MYGIMETLEVGDRIPMSWDDYLALDETWRGEYYDGAFIVSPSAVQRHQRIVARLVSRIASALPPTADVLAEWGWRPWPTTEFILDVVVFDRTDERHLTAVPHLVVEVLSDDRGRNLIHKFQLYARAGLPRYWVIDADRPTVVVYHLADDGTYHEVGRFADEHETTLELGPATLTLRPVDLVV